MQEVQAGGAECPQPTHGVTVKLCGVDACRPGALVFLAAPIGVGSQSSSLRVEEFSGRVIESGFLLTDPYELFSAGYSNVMLQPSANLGQIEISGDAQSRDQAPFYLDICIFVSG